ncbi:MAG: hypothetical protein R6U15_07535 [Candidatus Izemoplasmatales bacterium]
MALFSKIKEKISSAAKDLKETSQDRKQFNREVTLERKKVMREERKRQEIRLAREGERLRADERLRRYKERLKPQTSNYSSVGLFGTQPITSGKKKSKSKRFDVLTGRYI